MILALTLEALKETYSSIRLVAEKRVSRGGQGVGGEDGPARQEKWRRERTLEVL